MLKWKFLQCNLIKVFKIQYLLKAFSLKIYDAILQEHRFLNAAKVSPGFPV